MISGLQYAKTENHMIHAKNLGGKEMQLQEEMLNEKSILANMEYSCKVFSAKQHSIHLNN